MLGTQAGRLCLEQFQSQVRQRAQAGRAVVPAIALGPRGVKKRAARGQAGGRDQQQRRLCQQRQAGQIAQRVVRQMRVQLTRRAHIAVDHQAQRVGIAGTGHLGRRDVAGGARTVLDIDRLAQAARQTLGQHARRQVRRGTGGKTDHDAQRPARPAGLLGCIVICRVCLCPYEVCSYQIRSYRAPPHQSDLLTSWKCSTTGGAAKNGPTMPRHCGNSGDSRKPTVWSSSVSQKICSR